MAVFPSVCFPWLHHDFIANMLLCTAASETSLQFSDEKEQKEGVH